MFFRLEKNIKKKLGVGEMKKEQQMVNVRDFFPSSYIFKNKYHCLKQKIYNIVLWGF